MDIHGRMTIYAKRLRLVEDLPSQMHTQTGFLRNSLPEEHFWRCLALPCCAYFYLFLVRSHETRPGLFPFPPGEYGVRSYQALCCQTCAEPGFATVVRLVRHITCFVFNAGP